MYRFKDDNEYNNAVDTYLDDCIEYSANRFKQKHSDEINDELAKLTNKCVTSKWEARNKRKLKTSRDWNNAVDTYLDDCLENVNYYDGVNALEQKYPDEINNMTEACIGYKWNRRNKNNYSAGEDYEGGKIIGTDLNVTDALATLLLQQNKYLANLSLWNQYVVWNYTLGSQPVNRTLLGMPMKPSYINEWTYNLFNNFSKYGGKIPKPYLPWEQYFENPKEFELLPLKQQSEISNILLDIYSRNLQTIILMAPRPQDNIMVYKASTPYDPRLGDLNNSDFPFSLPQAPFNSTSYDPWFDFNAFLGSNNDSCCLWEIIIPANSPCLCIVHPYQAYLTEREIILPFGSTFIVEGARQVDMSYYADRDAPRRTQSKDRSMIGEVYRHDNWVPRKILQRKMRMLEAIYVPPNQ